MEVTSRGGLEQVLLLWQDYSICTVESFLCNCELMLRVRDNNLLLDQVIKDRKWKEVTNCFKFVETSASYILRKYYVGLLYYFEQAYFHGKTGPLIPPPSMYSNLATDWLLHI